MNPGRIRDLRSLGFGFLGGWDFLQPFLVILAAMLLLVIFTLLLVYGSEGVENMIFAESLLSSLAGAFVGAYAAFALQNLREVKRERSRNRDAVNVTVTKLAAMYQILGQIQNQAIDPARNPDTKGVPVPEDDLNKVRAVQMVGMDVEKHDHLRVSVDGLSFLIQSSNPNVVHEVAARPGPGRASGALLRLVQQSQPGGSQKVMPYYG